MNTRVSNKFMGWRNITIVQRNMNNVRNISLDGSIQVENINLDEY